MIHMHLSVRIGVRHPTTTKLQSSKLGFSLRTFPTHQKPNTPLSLHYRFSRHFFINISAVITFPISFPISLSLIPVNHSIRDT